MLMQCCTEHVWTQWPPQMSGMQCGPGNVNMVKTLCIYLLVTWELVLRALLSLVLSTAPALGLGPQRSRPGENQEWKSIMMRKLSPELHVHFSSVQPLSHVQLLVTPWTAAHQTSLSITNSLSLLKLMSIESVMSSSHLTLCHPLLLLPSVSPSIRVFSNESVLCIRWPKSWSFSFSISPSKEYSGLISFRMDWLDLLAVQGTLKSLLQHHLSKASILWCSAFFIVQFTSIHDYWKNHSFNLHYFHVLQAILTLCHFGKAFVLAW